MPAENSELRLFFGIALFRQKADIVGQRKRVLKKGGHLVHPPLQSVVVHHPKTTGEKRSLTPRQSIHPTFRVVARDQAIAPQGLLYRGRCALHARSSAGRNPTKGSISKLASISLLP